MSEPHIVRYGPAGFAIWSDDAIRWAAFGTGEKVLFQARAQEEWNQWLFQRDLENALTRRGVSAGDVEGIAAAVIEVLQIMKGELH